MALARVYLLVHCTIYRYIMFLLIIHLAHCRVAWRLLYVVLYFSRYIETQQSTARNGFIPLLDAQYLWISHRNTFIMLFLYMVKVNRMIDQYMMSKSKGVFDPLPPLKPIFRYCKVAL